MITKILINFLIALILTVLIECFISFIFGYRLRKYLLTITLINVITNPCLNLIILIINNLGYLNFIIVSILEFMVVLIEWKLLFYVLNKDSIKLLFLSIIINLFSFGLGLLMFPL
ncbi:UNVERIFIED_CONTAM: hypothetical protein Cloal_3882 [Acetivibrio alkalicellulosi]